MDSRLKHHAGPLLASIERRVFLRRGLSLGALSLLSGCDLGDKITFDEDVQKLLTAMSRWNDGVQSWLFDPKRLAPEFPESMITTPFPFNAYYGEDEVRVVEAAGYKLEVGGLVREKRAWTLPQLTAALARIADAAKAARLSSALEGTLAERLLLDLGALARKS